MIKSVRVGLVNIGDGCVLPRPARSPYPHPMTPDDLQTCLADHFAPWVQALNLTVTRVSPEATTLRMPLTPDLARMGGIVSGQALMAMADTAMILALAGHRGVFIPAATTNLHTQFLRPGTGPAILCQAQIIRAGRSLAFAQAALSAEDNGKPVARASATLALP